ncbi:MAG: prolyl oligopeptidase family serine peptidase [Longimicrobiales bacterium]|nr:prolyl oligopeptidase family serine peptidase [Longimicrobiales bacterium]
MKIPERLPSSRPTAVVLALLTALSLMTAATAEPGYGQVTATRSATEDSATPRDKRALQIADYRLWRSIEDETISDDGRWIAWTYSRPRNDDTLRIHDVESDADHVVPRASEPTFSDDGRWIAYFVAPPFEEVETLEREGEPVPRRVGLLDLYTGDTLSWGNAESFAFARSASHLLVKKGVRDADADHEGSDLILRNLTQGYDELVGSVLQAAFNEPGTHLAYTVDAAGGDGNGLYVVDLATGSRRAVDNAEDHYARLTWSEEGDAVAVLRGRKPEGMVERENHLLVFRPGEGDAGSRRFHLTPDAPGLREGWVLSEKGPMVFDEAGSTVFLGTRPQRKELEAWPEERLPLADVNIWHWRDDRIQSRQERELESDRSRTYAAAVHLDEGRLVHLADERMRSVEITRDGAWAIGRDDRAYVSDWKPRVADYYRVDTETGARTPILEAHLRTLGLSPDGAHYLYWKDGHVWDYRIEEDRHRNLTASAPVDFTDQEYDRYGEKPPHGVAGWAADGDAVLLYDRWDLWLQPLDGSAARSLTRGYGAENGIRLRYVRTDTDEDAVDLEEPLLLEGFGEWTKASGFFLLEGDGLRELTFEDRRFGRPEKADDVERYLFTVESWEDFPDLWISDLDFRDRERVSFANSQQDDFLWGRRILFDYTLDDGIRLQGTLAIPETYVPGQRLPMIVRFYEKYSQDLHRYPTPVYRHQPNFAGVVSRGYLLMQPDVHFRIGSSHSDMLEAVEAATRRVIELGYADPEAIGLSGHSYSGGGSAYIATRSDMFAAVAHGAAPINLVSEFNQLFVGSGQNNHRYDIYGQGRYATDPYADFDLYWEQSPISGVESMDTPVLYLHGEDDPTVNWEQGLEWYNALRFLGKPIIWLSYPGEGHGLRKLENRIDFQYRLQDFFGHHLRGEPAPGWMTEGVPRTEKERHLREYAPRIFRSGEEPGG